MRENAVLQADSLAVGYHRKIVVDGLSFSIMPGEICTLIGPNGSGKSTVLKTISAQLSAISGDISMCGDALCSLKEKDIAKRLSVLFTQKLSTERMTCGDVVGTGRYPYTGTLGILSDHDLKIVKESMELAGAASLYHTDFRQISDGQRQCVMLARAIAQQPKILLLDEPTSFLDIGHKLHILTLLRQLARERQIAVIQSLHELDLAQKFSDMVICIHKGKAERIGIPEEIFSGDYISALYEMQHGTYDPRFGNAEPTALKWNPRIFVIGGGGAGITIYRRLHRLGIPFAAGVLHESDLEYPVANALASVVVTEKAFEPISSESVGKAFSIMERCEKVICCTEHYGTMNAANRELEQHARAAGKLCDFVP
ncbi:MAG: ABC transporter ATP-binding protein [Oscillospiraceae bacterium]|nr:ABC transporter ATP-binding protein [Oscillospiraceae bacterium]